MTTPHTPESRVPPPEKAKAQIELRLEEDNSITVVVYDPVAFDNWDPEDDGVLGLFERVDPSSALIATLTTIISTVAYLPPVKKIVDARRGKEIDVSDRDFTRILEGRSGRAKKWDSSHIREVYDDRVARGIIDPGDFPFEEFERDFRNNNS